MYVYTYPRWAPRTVLDVVVVGDMVSSNGLDWLQRAARAAGLDGGEGGLPCQVVSPFDPVFAELQERHDPVQGGGGDDHDHDHDHDRNEGGGGGGGGGGGVVNGWSIRCVLRVVSPEAARAGAVAQALRRAGRVLCGHDLRGGGDWAVTLALAR